MRRRVMAKPHRNLRTMVRNERGTAIVSQFDCAFDAVARKSSVVNSGQAFAADAFNLYGYNDRNELGESSRYLGNNIAVTATPVPSEHRDYEYDPIGNRTQSTAGSLGWSYTSNELNQYTQESVPGGADTYSYDDDGNLTAIARQSAPGVAYTYDAENRLIAVAPPTPVAGDKKTEYLCDYMGRRVQKKISTYTDGAWVQETKKQYVYDGWNLIAEIDGSNTTYYAWGLDLSGTLQGAGGVGGLLGKFTGTAGYFALYDANGNITDYLDSQGLVVAHYEYDPYGSTLAASGAQKDEFALRFSTKYLDDMGLYYYGYRYYSPTLGRWLSRDPMEEPGGENLYAFVLNSPIDKIDPDGLAFYAIDGTWAWADGSNTNQTNTWKLYRETDEKPSRYRHGPGFLFIFKDPILAAHGRDTMGIAYEVKNRICADYCDFNAANTTGTKNNCTMDINLTGWSRGAVACMGVARMLNDDGCRCPDKTHKPVEVNWIGLFDAVEMVYAPGRLLPGDQGFPGFVPGNVKHFAHAIKTAWWEPYFPTTRYGRNERPFDLNVRGRTTHSDIGRNSQNNDAYNWIKSEAVNAGVIF
jgi:RHS repeat-associated protein